MSLTKVVDHIPVTERQFSQQIVGLAKLKGWSVYHTWKSLHSINGDIQTIIRKITIGGVDFYGKVEAGGEGIMKIELRPIPRGARERGHKGSYEQH